jgi:hypothetical protein
MARTKTQKVARILTTTLSGLLAVGLAAATAAPAFGQAHGTWTTTGSMHTAREYNTTTLLQNGQVLVAGGVCTSRNCKGDLLNSAELYNPSTGTWTETGSMTTSREAHTATVLANGEVLVAGGFRGSVILDSAELYNPSTGTWSATGNMTVGRTALVSVLLQNGEVLVAGGDIPGGSQPANSAELYNPSTGTFTATGSMHAGRNGPPLTVLPNGEALIAGGCSNYNDEGCDDQGKASCTAELFSNGEWSLTANLVECANAGTFPAMLPNGDALIDGLTFENGHVSEFYDPSTNVWQTTLNPPNGAGPLALLDTGKVLFPGGGPISGELYDASTNEWTPTGTSPIGAAALTPLLNGQVLATTFGKAALYTP